MSYRGKRRALFPKQEKERHKEERKFTLKKEEEERFGHIARRERASPGKKREWGKPWACPTDALGPCTKGFYLAVSGENSNRIFISFPGVPPHGLH